MHVLFKLRKREAGRCLSKLWRRTRAQAEKTGSRITQTSTIHRAHPQPTRLCEWGPTTRSTRAPTAGPRSVRTLGPSDRESPESCPGVLGQRPVCGSGRSSAGWSGLRSKLGAAVSKYDPVTGNKLLQLAPLVPRLSHRRLHPRHHPSLPCGLGPPTAPQQSSTCMGSRRLWLPRHLGVPAHLRSTPAGTGVHNPKRPHVLASRLRRYCPGGLCILASGR